MTAEVTEAVIAGRGADVRPAHLVHDGMRASSRIPLCGDYEDDWVPDPSFYGAFGAETADEPQSGTTTRRRKRR